MKPNLPNSAGNKKLALNVLILHDYNNNAFFQIKNGITLDRNKYKLKEYIIEIQVLSTICFLLA